MSHGGAHVRIAVGVVVERTKAKSAWVDYVWRSVAVLADAPDMSPWTVLKPAGNVTTFYAGSAEVELFRTETGNYRDNLATGAPLMWVALRATDSEPPYRLFAVTADPAEGESFTEAGNDLVDSVPMPEEIREVVVDFVATHHVERTLTKRKRGPIDPEALARRAPRRESEDE